VPEFPENSLPEDRFPFVLHGVSLSIPRSILTPELWQAFSEGYYEGSEIAALRRVVRPGDVVLEIGAGVGFISTFLLGTLRAGQVWAVEADPRLIPVIQSTHALNGVSAAILHGVAGRRDGTVKFHRQPAFWASSVVPLPGSTEETLPGIDIGRLISEMRPDVLVVDIEGGEREIFEGLQFPGVRDLIVEVHQPQIGGAGIARCFSALHSAGFAYNPDGSSGSNVAFSRFRPSRDRFVPSIWMGSRWSFIRRRSD
jgi:FkbM family methyltransferase